MNKTLVVIGGGAAGFFCAVNAARLNKNLQVILLEKTGKLLSKVKVSGGGRCNVTHHCFEIDELSKKYPRGEKFLKKAFHWFNTKDTINWFAERNVQLKAEADGRMFPVTDSSQTIIDCLLNEANKYEVDIRLHTTVEGIEQKANKFTLFLQDERMITADYICIACGGYPKTIQFDWIKKIGHTIEEPLPSLFTFNLANKQITELMGLSVSNALVKINGTKLYQQGPLLITHWGLSGPAVLKLSAWGARQLAAFNYLFSISVNWLGIYNEQTLREEWPLIRSKLSVQLVHHKNPFGLPNRLWQYFVSGAEISESANWSSLTQKQQNKLIQLLTNEVFEVKGKTTFKEEFVTCGGVSLSEIEVNTMQSKKVQGVYFAGEIMDVDGITGGFNFQHAWTSSFIAAKHIASLE
jgi:predicted Rossmann fold flavoprotein